MIFWSETTIPEHQRLSVFILKNPVSDHYFFNHFFGGFGRKNQLFTIFNVDHFSRLLQTQNNPKIFFGRFASRVRSWMLQNTRSRAIPTFLVRNPIIHYTKSKKFGDSRALSRGFWPAGRARKAVFFTLPNRWFWFLYHSIKVNLIQTRIQLLFDKRMKNFLNYFLIQFFKCGGGFRIRKTIDGM